MWQGIERCENRRLVRHARVVVFRLQKPRNQLGLDDVYERLLLAVAFAASGSFLTPYGYATNLIVQNIGGYTRGDYLRFGLPISVAYSVGILTMLCVTYF